MSYKIIIDSCGELTEEMKKSGTFETASLQIDVDGHHIIDDETFDQADFLKRIRESDECPKSSCPSPERYMEEYHCEAEHIYAVTLSAELSGSYNSAVLGKNLYEEEYGEKDIYVFNSRSASVGETLIGLKIAECEKKGLSFKDVIDTVEAYIEEQHTYFLLETLDILKKNGRLKGLKAVVATALNIKPVMGSTPDGNIQQLANTRGMKKGLVRMVEEIVADLKNPEEKILAISHCNCRERAEAVKNMLLEKAKFKDIIIVDTAGISSMYAADGGVIVVV
ncbi:DegV family protein [Dorea sp.]